MLCVFGLLELDWGAKNKYIPKVVNEMFEAE